MAGSLGDTEGHGRTRVWADSEGPYLLCRQLVSEDGRQRFGRGKV